MNKKYLQGKTDLTTEQTLSERLDEDIDYKPIKFRVNWYTKYIIKKDGHSLREMRNTYVKSRSVDDAIKKVKYDNEKLWAMCNAVYIAEGLEMGLKVDFDDKYSKDCSGGQSIVLKEEHNI